MRLVWPLLLGVFRTAYLAYSVWCLLFPLAILGVGALMLCDWGASHLVLRQGAQILLASLGVLAFYAMVRVWMRRKDGDPNAWQSGFMAWFGTLKLFRNPGGADGVSLRWPSTFLVENPRGYRVSGADTRHILQLLQPGDILLRGYAGYVDGEFIRRSARTSRDGFQPGWFTHVALYAGELGAAERDHVPAPFQAQSGYFSPGPQMVIHSMAKGVHTEDVLTFLRCDYLAVLRLPQQLALATAGSKLPEHTPRSRARVSPSDAPSAQLSLTLEQGGAVSREQVVHVARQSALERIGEPYDFDCSDTTQFHRFSCAELLYYCLRGVRHALNLHATPHALYPLAPWFPRLHLLERTTITPDDYYTLCGQGHLQCVWEDGFSAALHRKQGARR